MADQPPGETVGRVQASRRWRLLSALLGIGGRWFLLEAVEERLKQASERPGRSDDEGG